MKLLRIGTFIAALLSSLALTFWPPLLYIGDSAPERSTTALILLGLCAGVVFGSGILSRAPQLSQYGCAAAAWTSIAAVAYLSSL